MMKMRERLWMAGVILLLSFPMAAAQQSGSQETAQAAGSQQGSTPSTGAPTSQGQQPPPPGLPGPASRPSSGEAKPQSVTPATAQPAGGAPSEEQEEEQPPEEHTGPLGGVETAAAAAAGERSYILPTFSAAQDVDTNSQYRAAGSGLQAVSILSAHVALNRLERHGQFAADYLGGGLIYESRNSQTNSSATFQQFGFSQDFQLRRWDLLLTDRVSYLPESAFGFGGIGLGSFGTGASWGLGGGLNPINSNFSPNQSLLTGQNGQFSNIAAAQGQYSVTRRTSVFATGAYDSLQFGGSGVSIGGQKLLSGNNEIFSGGLNQRLTSLDTLSFVYSHSQFNYVGTPTTVYNNFWQVGYGRRVSGRLSLSLFGGPEISTVRSLGVNLNRQVLFSGAARLEYARPRTSLGLSYFQGASGGSGVIAGAKTSDVYGDVNRHLTRAWEGGLNLGYAHNSALVTPAAGNRSAYNSEYAGATLSRDFGRSLKLFLMYNLQREDSNQAFCAAGNACGRSFLRHVFGVGLTYTRRPIGI